MNIMIFTQEPPGVVVYVKLHITTVLIWLQNVLCHCLRKVMSRVRKLLSCCFMFKIILSRLHESLNIG